MSAAGRNRAFNLPPVGVLAVTQNVARSLANELNINSAVCLSPTSTSGRGVSLSALLVDESAWPMTEVTKRNLLPCLAQYQGYVLRLSRHDPKKRKTG